MFALDTTFMRFLSRSIFLILSLAICGCIKDEHQNSEQTTLVKVGDKAPDFTTELYPSSSITLSELQGAVVLLTFWDPTCPTCREEIAVVQEQIIDHFKGKEFHYLPVAREQDYNSIKEFCLANGYTFPIGLDPKREIYNLYATQYVPRSFIIDQQGIIRNIYVEYELAELSTIVETIEKMLR